MSEAELVRRAQAGDGEAFGRLAEGCRAWLHGLCFRLVCEHHAAEDLAQEAILFAYRDLGQLRQPASFHPWLARIARNACYSYLRRRLPLALAEAGGEPGRVVGDGWGLGAALERLGADDRRLLLLRYGAGYTLRELGQAWALSPAALKSRLHRARARLKREMAMTERTASKRWELQTVLLVTASKEVEQALAPALQAAGYRVELLATGRAGLEAAAQRQGELMILDQECGEPTWLEVLLLVQADAWMREYTPVMTLVSPGTQEQLILAWQAGAMACLRKPADPAQVVEMVGGIRELWAKKREGKLPEGKPPCSQPAPGGGR